MNLREMALRLACEHGEVAELGLVLDRAKAYLAFLEGDLPITYEREKPTIAELDAFKKSEDNR